MPQESRLYRQRHKRAIRLAYRSWMIRSFQHIESFRCCRGALLAERQSRGYMLYHANSGPFGRTVIPMDDAPRFIATEDIFWAAI
jgi:hypothetical protein